MNAKKALESLVPFIVIGVAIALFVGLLFMFFYIALWGVLIGAVLWIITLAKDFFFPPKEIKEESGRIIEYEDKK